jgi:phosphonate transport system substrate-binding protein
VEVVQRDTYAEINDLIESGYVDLAFVCSLAYVIGKEDFDMELLVVPEVNGASVYHSYIIVPAESGARSLQDLKGKTFAFTDPLSNSGRLYPSYLLQQAGTTADIFFDRYIFTYSHDNSIRAVAENIVDGAAVDSLVYDYMVNREPEIGARTKIVHVSPSFGIPPVVTHPSLEPEIKSRLRGLLLNMDKGETGKALLQEINITRFVIGDDSSYDLIRDIKGKTRW